MHGENAVRELGQMASGQTEYARREGQEQRVFAAAGPAREPPDEQRPNANLERGQEFAVEGFQSREDIDALGQTVAALLAPQPLRPKHLDRAAHRHDASEDDAVVGEVDEDAGEGGSERQCRLQPQERATRPAGRGRCFWRRRSPAKAPRPLEEAQRRRHRHCHGGAFQAHPGQREDHRRKRPTPAIGISAEETRSQEQQPQREQPGGGLHAEQHAPLRIERRQHSEEQDPRQPRRARRHGDQRHPASEQHDLERLDDEQRVGLVEHPVEGRDQEQPQGVVAVGARDAAVEGGEPPLGHVVGDLEVVERVVPVAVADQVDEVEAVQRVPGERRPVGQDAGDEQRERRVAPRRNGAPGLNDEPSRPTPAPRALRGSRLLQAPSALGRPRLAMPPSQIRRKSDAECWPVLISAMS